MQHREKCSSHSLTANELSINENRKHLLCDAAGFSSGLIIATNVRGNGVSVSTE